ncbi:thioredoxin family protein [Maribacter sp. ANRC-HE7]|uniref:Thioredoxin family protein n=1 Tax=Maribacter aquimaris TaxID=2737171 RepID=A0ABR7UWZ0_9FLAO|nr:thioredoxin family protein [Maribacter aquimaris]MBD0777057.1 thioredoxin family protein [Maribacter aquimaris]
MNTSVLENLELTTEEIIQKGIEKGMSYPDYRALMDGLAAAGKATGPEVSEDMVNYTLLNQRRMKRLDKTLKIDEASADRIKGYTGNKVTWLVLTESWCGDAAQSLPMIHKVAALNDDISLKIILRDENLEIMNRFLTNGAMSIPKLVMVEDASGKILNEWGSRPKTAQQMVVDYKNEHGVLTPEFKEELQVWYNKDKGQSMLNDLLELLALK